MKMAQTLNTVQQKILGLRAKYYDLLLLLSSAKPVACCLQDLLIEDMCTSGNRQSSLLSAFPTQSNGRATGGAGAGIIVRKAVPHSRIYLNTSQQAVASRICALDRPLTLCSISSRTVRKFKRI
jgi:hypothetical protein